MQPQTIVFQISSISIEHLSSLFYKKKYWTIVGQDMVAAVLIVISSGHMHKKINYTHIALKKQQKISNYRPISLCNAIYKGISKVLVD